MFCGSCGMKLEKGERFCSRCGSPVEESGKSSIGMGYRFLILLLSLLILAGTGASLWFLGGVQWLREVLLL